MYVEAFLIYDGIGVVRFNVFDIKSNLSKLNKQI